MFAAVFICSVIFGCFADGSSPPFYLFPKFSPGGSHSTWRKSAPEPEERGIQLTAGRVESEKSLGQTLSDRDPSNQGSDSLARHKITQLTILGQFTRTLKK